MPYSIRKVPNKSCYRVSKKYQKKGTRRVFSKCTTKKNAEKQVRLLRAIEYGRGRFIPNGRNRTVRKK